MSFYITPAFRYLCIRVITLPSLIVFDKTSISPFWHILSVLQIPFADVYSHRFTVASADFSPFVVTHKFHTPLPLADETVLGLGYIFPASKADLEPSHL